MAGQGSIPGGTSKPSNPLGLSDFPRIADHEVLRSIGKGSYGEVWLAKNLTGTLRAVKVVHRNSFTDARPFEREFGGLKRFEPISGSHAGFVRILHVGRDAEDRVLLLRYGSGG